MRRSAATPCSARKWPSCAAGGKEARTHYAVLERFAKATLLECRLEPGRTHQIRVHLASIKHPLAGDPVYGKPKSGDARLDAFPRQALHAWRLALRSIRQAAGNGLGIALAGGLRAASGILRA
jgi:23S rRNA pseudouridine1911/1915/1917 synthase